MTLDERIAKLKTSLAKKQMTPDLAVGLASEILNGFHGDTPKLSEALRNWASEDFTAGADALAEVYRLQGKIAAIDQFYEVGGVGGAAHSLSISYKAQLEALLKQMEKV